MEEKIDFIFGPTKVKDDLKFYREELVFWHSQNAELLEYSKKELHANNFFNLIKKYLGKTDEKVDLIVNFSEDLSSDFKFHSKEGMESMLNSLDVIITQASAFLRRIEIHVEDKKTKIICNLKKEELPKTFENGLEAFVKNHNNKRKSNLFNSEKCYVENNIEFLALMFVFENKTHELKNSTSIKGNASEKRNQNLSL